MTTDTADAVVDPATVRHTVGSDGLVFVALHDGDLRIRGVAGEDVRLRADDGRSLDGLAIERGARSLTVRAGGPGPHAGPRGGGSRDLEIEMPAGASLVVESSSSDIVADGLRGDQRYRSGSGDLTLRDVHGSVTVEAMSGDLEITATGPARLDLRTVSGDVQVRGDIISALRATTTSGDMRIAGRFDGPGPFGLQTVSGDVSIGTAGDLRVDARTITGDLHGDIGRMEQADGRRSLIIGAGRPSLDVRSTSGDVHVSRAHAPNAIAPAPEEALPDDPATPIAGADDARLDALRALERGEIDLDEARRRLESIDATEPDQETDHGR